MKRLVSMIILTSVTLMTVLGSAMFDGTEAEAKSNKTRETSVNAGASLVFSNTLETTEKDYCLIKTKELCYQNIQTDYSIETWEPWKIISGVQLQDE